MLSPISFLYVTTYGLLLDLLLLEELEDLAELVLVEVDLLDDLVGLNDLLEDLVVDLLDDLVGVVALLLLVLVDLLDDLLLLVELAFVLLDLLLLVTLEDAVLEPVLLLWLTFDLPDTALAVLKPFGDTTTFLAATGLYGGQ